MIAILVIKNNLVIHIKKNITNAKFYKLLQIDKRKSQGVHKKLDNSK